MLKRKEKLTSDMGYSADQDGNYIIAGTRITGDILSENNILIEGEIMGNISCKGKVTVGNTGLVKGNISCYTSEIYGTIEGEIKVEDVLNLRDTSKFMETFIPPNSRLMRELSLKVVVKCRPQNLKWSKAIL